MTHSAVLVTHGSPSEPELQEQALAGLAQRVADELPGWDVKSATLAASGRLETVLTGMTAPLVYPYLMAQGFFTGRVLPKRLSAFDLKPMRPFGVDPALFVAVLGELRSQLAQRGWQASDTAVLIAAHGSAVSKRSADAANGFARALQFNMDFRDVRTGFVEQEPFLEPAARGMGQAICLPYFAINAGHMLEDVPAALHGAGFDGPVLPAFIDWPQTPQIIAQALRAEVANLAKEAS